MDVSVTFSFLFIIFATNKILSILENYLHDDPDEIVKEMANVSSNDLQLSDRK